MAFGLSAGAATLLGSVAAPVIGGLLGGSSGGSIGGSAPAGNTTSTATSAPWAGQQPYLKTQFAEASRLYGKGAPVAGFDPAQTRAMNLITSYANNGGNAAVKSAGNTINRFASGGMMNNPYLTNMVKAADDSIIRGYKTAVDPGIKSSFSAAGRYGSGAQAVAESQARQDLATQLGNTNANIYGNAYESGLGKMLAASSYAPTLQNADLARLNALQGVGAAKQAQQQAILDSPQKALQQYAQNIAGNYGSNTTSSNPYYTNQGANILGGALMGSQIANNVNWGGLFGNNNTASQPAFNYASNTGGGSSLNGFMSLGNALGAGY